MSQIHYVNGSWVPPEDATISVFDLSVSRGLAVFDTIRTYGNEPFRLNEHLRRLNQAAATLQIPMPCTNQELKELVYQGIERNQNSETVIKITVTGGINEGLLSSSKPGLVILFLPLKMPSKEHYVKGISLVTERTPRSLPQIKTINYIPAKVGLQHAREAGADDALFIDQNENMLETTVSNIFLYMNGMWVTPPEEGILNGITRQVILEMFKRQNEPYIERSVKLNELRDVDEAFCCSSIKQIVPVRQIDNAIIGSGNPGKRTRQSMRDFDDYVKADA